MNIYNFVFLLIVFSYFIIDLLSKKIHFDRKSIFLIFVGSIFVLLSAIRDNSVSIDLNLYLNLFESTKNHSIFNIILDAFNFNHPFMTDILNGYYEAGFILFIKIIYTFFDFDLAFKLFTSLFINTSVLWFIHKYSKNELISVSVYFLYGFYTQSYVIIRQYMALAILIIALHFLLKNENKKFFLLVLIAMSFHKTSICFAIVYFIKKYWKKIYTHIPQIICLTLFFFFISKSLITWSVEKFYPFYSNKIISGEGLNLLVLLTIILIIPFILKTIKIEELSKFDFVFVLFLIGVLLQIFTYNFSLLNRLALYFQFIIILFIPNYIKLKKYNKILNILIIVCFLAFFNFIVLKDSGSQVNNYKFMNEIIFYGY